VRRFRIILLLVLASVPLARLGAADLVAADMRGVLRLAFADAQDGIQKDPASACRVVEHTRQVFGSLLTEYSTRSGDGGFKKTLRDWFHRYCGYGPEKPLPSDGD
jgi:hypothetical protein